MTNADVVAYIGQWRLSSVAARAPAFARDTVAKTAMGLTPLTSFTATLLVVRNQHTLRAWNTRQEENRRRAAAGLPPKTRKRRSRPSPASPPGRPDPQN